MWQKDAPQEPPRFSAGTVSITFQTQNIPTLLDEFTTSNEEQRA